MHKFNLDGLAEVIEKLQGKPVYITLDLDVLDPSVFREQELRRRAVSHLWN